MMLGNDNLGLPDKTRAEGDKASGQLNPAEKSLGGAIQAAADATELGEEVVATFHRLANPAEAWSAQAPRRGLQAKAGGLGARPAGAVAVGAVGLSRGQAADIEFLQRSGQSRWRHDQRGKQHFGVATVVGIGRGHDCSQGHGPTVARELQGSPAFGPVHRRRPGLFAPFLAGFLEPSRRTWSQLIPCSVW